VARSDTEIKAVHPKTFLRSSQPRDNYVEQQCNIMDYPPFHFIATLLLGI